MKTVIAPLGGLLGQSVWELMQTRMSPIDLLYAAVAAFVAFRIPNIQRLRNLFY